MNIYDKLLLRIWIFIGILFYILSSFCVFAYFLIYVSNSRIDTAFGHKVIMISSFVILLYFMTVFIFFTIATFNKKIHQRTKSRLMVASSIMMIPAFPLGTITSFLIWRLSHKNHNQKGQT